MTENGKEHNGIELKHKRPKYTYELTILKMIFVLLLLLTVGMATVIFLWTYPFKVIEFAQLPLEVDKTRPIYPGDYVPVHWRYEKFTNKPTHIFVYLINGRTIILDDIWSARQAGKYDYIGSQSQIPINYITAGWWHVRYVFHYELNPFRTVTLTVETEPFLVTARPSATESKKDAPITHQKLSPPPIVFRGPGVVDEKRKGGVKMQPSLVAPPAPRAVVPVVPPDQPQPQH